MGGGRRHGTNFSRLPHPPCSECLNQNHEQEHRCSHRHQTYHTERPNVLAGPHPGQESISSLERPSRMLQGKGLYSLRPKQSRNSDGEKKRRTDERYYKSLSAYHKLTISRTTSRGPRNRSTRHPPEERQTLQHRKNRFQASNRLVDRPNNQGCPKMSFSSGSFAFGSAESSS